MKKHDKNFWYIFGLVSILPLIYTFFDVWGFRMWDALGGWETQAYLSAGPIFIFLKENIRGVKHE